MMLSCSVKDIPSGKRKLTSQDRMQEWCCIADPHFLLLPFTPRSALSAAAYSHEMACCKIELQKYPISNPNLALKWVLSDQLKAKHGKE
jgi:hypothetical protein